MQVNILDAKNRLSELIKSAQAGEEVVIAKRGEPVVRLVSVEQTTNARLADGSGAALLAWLKSRPTRSPIRNDDQIEIDIQAGRDAWD